MGVDGRSGRVCPRLGAHESIEDARRAHHAPVPSKLPVDTVAGRENVSGYDLETNGVFLFARNYIPEGTSSTIPYITPIDAKDLTGLPTAYVVTNGFDPLRDTGHEYARLLAKAGNKVDHVDHEEFTHGSIQFTETSKKCLAATREIGRDVGRLLRGRPLD